MRTVNDAITPYMGYCVALACGRADGHLWDTTQLWRHFNNN